MFGVPATSTCRVRAVWGYGERIGDLQTSLDVSASIEISIAELDALVEGVDEWLYAIHVSLLDDTVRLGLLDSSVMFVEGAESGVREVARHFTDLIWDSQAASAR